MLSFFTNYETHQIKLVKRERKVTILFCFTVSIDADTCGVKFIVIKLIEEILKIKANADLF